MTIFQVLQDLVRRPGWHIRAHWNWKTAIMSVAMRSSLFFVTNLAFGFRTATRAWLIDAVFRIPLVGVYGAIDQAFTDAQPMWAASAMAMVFVPLLARAIEFVIHWLAGTPELLRSVLVSLAFSAVSNPFTLFAMRRGALVVGVEGEDSSWRDLSRLPRIAVDFLSRGARNTSAS
jgi:hypothetical protein